LSSTGTPRVHAFTFAPPAFATSSKPVIVMGEARSARRALGFSRRIRAIPRSEATRVYRSRDVRRGGASRAGSAR
jgi:hypothetical protein